MLNVAVWMAESGQLLAAGSSDDDSGGLGLVFLLSGFVFYSAIYFRYRNTDKRHSHESETEATMVNMKEKDDFVQSKKGLTNRRMSGANNRAVRGARNKIADGIVGKFRL
ncbi:growth/differentiation factor [Salinibacterium sp. UTAS2018]|uniref:growth/differentiation factor n=1 Tax=Salinibacterium sp. UTAS2018 TaxID=2508880 RepID=UPI0010097B0D|nr:growth/differentiation factor [Salinibacterium sp. UTAS2018]QAV69273.1 growth/differentiation factor [Salinibacterium sp. UTAS2018]